MKISVISFRCLLLVLTTLFVVTTVSSQFNVKVGYNVGHASADINNQILDTFNLTQMVNYDEYIEMRPLSVMHGVSLGLRQGFAFGAVTVDWENLSRSLSAVGITRLPLPSQPVSETIELTYTFNMLMVGLETRYGRLGLGSALGRNFVSITRETVQGEDFSLLRSSQGSTSQTFARFHFSLNFSGSPTVAFALKPFIQIPLSKVDLSSVATELGINKVETEESFPLFGLSFSFYNGRQD